MLKPGPTTALFELAICAASAVVLIGDTVWVLADDRLALDRHRVSDGSHLPPIALRAGSAFEILPKKKKRDLEALADVGGGRLLALGSGSKPNRERGYLVDTAAGVVDKLDLSPLYARLARDIEGLNIEGALMRGAELLLAHRAVGRAGESCILRLDADTCLSAPDGVWPASALIGLTRVDLGELDGVPLAFTDLALGPDGGLHYLAAAENTSDAYADGYCTGSVFGRLDASFRATPLLQLQPRVKAEGLAWWKQDRWLLVTDADDPECRASLLELRYPA